MPTFNADHQLKKPSKHFHHTIIELKKTCQNLRALWRFNRLGCFFISKVRAKIFPFMFRTKKKEFSDHGDKTKMTIISHREVRNDDERYNGFVRCSHSIKQT